MALATLSVDLVAKVAQFENDLKRVARTSEQQGERMAAAFGLAKGALGTLTAGLTVGASVAFFRNIVDGIDALNDLSDATGSSIENLSALEDVAARTGTKMETVGSAVLKLNKTLADAKPGSDAAAALDAIGLSAQELKKLDPAEALRRTAVALSGFADDGNKARLTQELFGKSLREVAPLLKDLAESGSLNATVTTAQAKAAEAFNIEIFKLQKAAVDVARDLAGPVVEAINATIEAFRKGAKEGKSFRETLADEQWKMLGFSFGDIGVEVARLQQQLAIEPKGTGLYASLEKQLAEKVKLLEGAQKAATAAFKPSQNYGDGLPKPSAPVIGGGPKGGDAAKRLSDYLAMTRAIAEGEEQAARDVTEAWQAWERIQLADHEEKTKAWALQWKQVFAEIDAEQERAIEEGQAAAGIGAELASEFAAQAARNIQDTLGQTLVQVFDGSFQSIGKLWANTLKQMAAQAAAAQLNKYLFGDSFGKEGGSMGGAVGDLFKWFGSLGTRADGGPVQAGRPYLVGERGPEIVVPRQSGTVLPNGTAPAGVTINNIVNVQGDASANTLRLIQNAQAGFAARLQRQGAY